MNEIPVIKYYATVSQYRKFVKFIHNHTLYSYYNIKTFLCHNYYVFGRSGDMTPICSMPGVGYDISPSYSIPPLSHSLIG